MALVFFSSHGLEICPSKEKYFSGSWWGFFIGWLVLVYFDLFNKFINSVRILPWGPGRSWKEIYSIHSYQ